LTKYYKQKQTANGECKHFDEIVESIITACPILAKEQYTQRHDTLMFKNSEEKCCSLLYGMTCG
jgi:hypothetical protein